MSRSRGGIWYFLACALIPGHLFGWAVEWSAAVCSSILGMWYYGLFMTGFPRASRLGLVALAFLLVVSVSAYLRTLLVEATPTGFRDLFDLTKPILVYFSCVFGLVLPQATVKDLRHACRIVLSFSLTCALVLAMDIPILSMLVEALYADTKTGISGVFVRLSIPFENPNFLGLFATLSLCVAFFCGRSADWVLAILALAVCGLTGSRTAWATSALLVVAFFCISLYQQIRRLRGPTLAGLFVTSLLAAGVHHVWPVLMAENQRVLDFMELVRSGDLSADASYSDRVHVRRAAMDLLNERPVLGVGAMKYTEVSVVDNQLFGLLLRFGVLGTFLTLALLGVAAYYRASISRSEGHLIGFCVACGVVCLWAWTGSFFDNVRLASLTVIFLTVIGRRDSEFIH